MKALFNDLSSYIKELKGQGILFYAACGYLTFSYLRPQVTFPAIDILPWTQLCILIGLGAAVVQKNIKFDTTMLLLVFYMIAIIISSSYSSYPDVSWNKIDVAYIWIIEVWFFISCFKNIRQVYLILILFLLFMAKMSFFGAKTWVARGFGFEKWGIAGPTGYFANSGEFSLLMAMVAVISIAFLIGVGKQKSIYILLPITAIMTVIAASSRGGQLAILVGVVYLLLAYKLFSLKYIIIISIAAFSVYHIIPEEQMARFQGMGEDDTSKSRLAYWSAGYDMMNRYPFTGVGFYSFPEYYQDHYKDFSNIESEFLANRREVAHNSFIEIGSSLGYTGLVLYCLILTHIYSRLSAVKKIATMHRDEVGWAGHLATGIIASLLVYIVGSLFMSVAFYPYIFLLIMFSNVLHKNVKEYGIVKSAARVSLD